MTTYNTDADVIESSVDFGLVDPTTVAGRAHRLHNNSAANLTVSSTGATPFSSGGVNSATLTLLPGAGVNIYSNGTRWTVASGLGRQAWAGTGVSNGSGDVVIVFPTAFVATPVIEATAQAADAVTPIDLRITAVSTTGCTIRARQSSAVVVALIGLTVLVATTPLVGLTVHITASQAGASP